MQILLCFIGENTCLERHAVLLIRLYVITTNRLVDSDEIAFICYSYAYKHSLSNVTSG